MILSDIVQRFVADSPSAVMAQALVENALPPSVVDSRFERHSPVQYTRDLLFSEVVRLMSLVVCRLRPSINAAFHQMAATLTVTQKAVYDQIDRVETSPSAAVVRHSGTAGTAVVDALGGPTDPWLAGSRTRIRDGSHRPGTEHRIAPRGTTRAAALAGPSRVIFEPASMLVRDGIRCQDGHAPERSMTAEILALVGSPDRGIADRNFGTTSLLWGLAARGGFLVIRQHGSTWTGEARGNRVSWGRCETGAVLEQKLKLTHDAGEIGLVRRVTVERDSPTRDGDRSLPILTHLSAEDADAIAVAELDRGRWTLETACQELEAALHGAINTLGYPKAAGFAGAIAWVAYHRLRAVKAALRSGHGTAVADPQSSGFSLADEVAGPHRGMMIAIPREEGGVFHARLPHAISPILKELARAVRWSEFRKQPRGPKKPRPKRRSGAKVKHVAPAKLLKQEKANHGKIKSSV